MNESPAPVDASEEILALIATLHATEQRLEAITAGEVDTVADGAGRTLLLRRSQEHLRRSDAARQAAILNSLPAHIALLDRQGLILSVNAAWRRFASDNAGTRGSGVGVNYLDTCDRACGVNSAEARPVAAGIRSVLAGSSVNYSIEYPCHSPTQRRWFLMSVTPLGDGAPAGAVVMHLDVSAERKTEENLRVSEARFRQLAETIDDSFFLRSMDDSQVFYVSPSYERIWGRTCESLYAEPASWAAAVHPDDLQRVMEKHAERRNGEVDAEFRILRPGGEMRWVHVREFPVRDADGTPIRTAGIASDITRRKQADQALADSETRLRALSENSSDVIAITAGDGRIQYVSPSIRKIAGYEPEALVGHNFLDLVHPDDRADAVAKFRELVGQPGAVQRVERRYRRKDGAWMVSENIAVNLLHVPAIAGVVTTMRDITQRKRDELELAQTHQQLLEASRHAGMAEVATNVLHNVGNVLNSVNVSASLVIDSINNSRAASLERVAGLMRDHAADLGAYLTSDPKGRHIPAFLDQVSRDWMGQQREVVLELESLRSHIDHIKEIVAMQQGFARLSGTTEIVDVKELVEDSVRITAAAFTRHRVDVIREFDDVPPISVEKHKVLQILVNLLRNAKQACDHLVDAQKCVTLRIDRVDGRIRIAVGDNGIGIRAENLARLFSHGFTTRKEGHGFGLHSSALAAREMGGTLIAHSDGPGRGATFTLELPMQAAP